VSGVIEITPTLALDERELVFRFVQSEGPGGQNVNKVATSVELRFDATHTSSLPAEVSQRLVRLAGKRVTEQGVVVITARRYRTQDANRQDAIRRLVKLIQQALVPPNQRRATRPSGAARAERLADKKRRGAVKQTRRSRPSRDEEE